jgi:hypothetical protein
MCAVGPTFLALPWRAVLRTRAHVDPVGRIADGVPRSDRVLNVVVMVIAVTSSVPKSGNARRSSWASVALNESHSKRESFAACFRRQLPRNALQGRLEHGAQPRASVLKIPRARPMKGEVGRGDSRRQEENRRARYVLIIAPRRCPHCAPICGFPPVPSVGSLQLG